MKLKPEVKQKCMVSCMGRSQALCQVFHWQFRCSAMSSCHQGIQRESFLAGIAPAYSYSPNGKLALTHHQFTQSQSHFLQPTGCCQPGAHHAVQQAEDQQQGKTPAPVGQCPSASTLSLNFILIFIKRKEKKSSTTTSCSASHLHSIILSFFSVLQIAQAFGLQIHKAPVTFSCSLWSVQFSRG